MILRPEVPLYMPVVVRLRGDVLSAFFEAYFEPFIAAMKGAGMIWKKPTWIKMLGEMTDDPHDRVAELCCRLTAAGFVVDVADEEGGKRAVSGEFRPEHRRWLFLAGNGERKGWVIAIWPKGEDFKDRALGILGARHLQWRVAIPPSAVEEAADFAERFDFRMTARVQALLEQHRQAIAAGAVVQNHKLEQPLAPPTERPTLSAEPVAVLDELLDTD